MCLSQTVKCTSQDRDHQTEEEQDPVCKPVNDFLVMEADAGIQNQTILQDYIVPLNLIERWGNAMGILGSFLYKVTFFIIFLLFLR